MDVIQSLILGLVQGLTEFLPVSSSGHLVLIPALLGWKSPGLAFDTVLHLGTLVAVLAYFRRDWVRMIAAGLRSLSTRRADDTDTRVVWFIAIGCLPAAFAGIAFGEFFESLFHDPVAVGYFLLITAGLLAVSERVGTRDHGLERLGLGGAILIGAAQALAILPGVSRSGATIAGGLFTGMDREASARFSFLLATPAIFGAGLVQAPKAIREFQAQGDLVVLLVGFATSAIVGYLVVSLFLRYIRARSLYPFAAYCAVLGLAVLTVLGPALS